MMGQQQTVAGGALRRMILALAIAALMVTMMVVMAAPVFAKAQHPDTDGVILGEAADCQGTVSSSGNEASKCSIKDGENNKGGTGGGGATVDKDEGWAGYTGVDDEGHIVNTPSGNLNAHGNIKKA
jgi:hypothetical protein